MECIRPIVGGQCVFFSAKTELTLGNTVPHSANRSSEVRVVLQVAFQGIEPESDLANLAGLIGDFDGRDDRAISHDLHSHCATAQGLELNRLAIRGLAEWLFCDCAL